MATETKKEIADLLKKIVVFEKKFKEEILQKSAGLEETKLQKLKKVLLEVKQWQTKLLQNKIANDPDFYYKVMDVKRKADQAVIDTFRQKFKAEDHKKMEIILNKIHSL
ncbi:MAG TPA: hypothetical protein VLK22_04250 [Candidatus Udaeobacter sp.]|nr:hypothetical protein [Candidatus Udaeobacter sp.]